MTFHYLVVCPFEERDFERLGVKDLLAQGIDVRVWDLSQLIDPAEYQKLNAAGSIHSFAGYGPLKDREEVVATLRKLTESDLVLCTMGYCYEYLWLFKALSSSKARFGAIYLGSLPPSMQLEPPLPAALWARLKSKTQNLIKRPDKLLRKAFQLLPPGAMGVGAYHFVLAGGSSSLSHCKLLNDQTKVIWAHSMDYDAYLRFRQGDLRPSLPARKHAVFLDENVPFHPDYPRMQLSPPCSPESYYGALVTFFEKIENLSGLPVIIAAHPRFRFESHPDFFNGRAIGRGKTFEWVREADFVITHSSTAISAAILYRKPFIMVGHPSFRGRFEEALLMGMACELKKRVYWLDEPLSPEALSGYLETDLTAYERYRINYLKAPRSPETPLWKIFGDALRAGI